MKRLLVLTLISAFCIFNTIQAKHIISGTMAYKCLGNDQYEITMILYRDCFGGGAQFDHPAIFTIYNNGELYSNQSVDLNNSETVSFFPYEDCDPTGAEVCVEKGVYIFTTVLPTSNTDYVVAYQRCCWADAVSNIDMPEERGITVTTTITSLAQSVCNSQNLIEFPLTFMACPGEPISIPLDGLDFEGDSLTYEHCFPLEGAGPEGSPSNPSGSVTGCEGLTPNPACPPPYNTLPYASGFDPSNPFPSENGISFNPTTNAMEFTPTAIGRFVYAICITEFRNGQILGTYQQTLDLTGFVESTTAVDEQSAANLWKTVYLPTTKHLQVSGQEMNEATLQLYDLQGQLLQMQKVEQANQATFSTDQLTTGIYLIQIQAGQQRQVMKVMVY